jgi:hypothetical protein
MPFKEIIAVYCKNHIKSINKLGEKNAELLTVQGGGIYSYDYASKD